MMIKSKVSIQQCILSRIRTSHAIQKTKTCSSVLERRKAKIGWLEVGNRRNHLKMLILICWIYFLAYNVLNMTRTDG